MKKFKEKSDFEFYGDLFEGGNSKKKKYSEVAKEIVKKAGEIISDAKRYGNNKDSLISGQAADSYYHAAELLAKDAINAIHHEHTWEGLNEKKADRKEEKLREKAAHAYMKAGEAYEKNGDDFNAKLAYENAHWQGCKEAYVKAGDMYKRLGRTSLAKEMYDKANFKPAETKSSKTIDNVVMTLMLFSGMGILYQVFSREAVMASTNQLMAPPFPNYLIYVLPLIVITGGIYFLWRKAKRDLMNLIPLSF